MANTVKQPPLHLIQNWMKTVLIERGSLQEKLETAEGQSGFQIEQLVKSRGRISAHRRLDIYAAGYVMRLVECLKTEFSVLCAYMGEEFFVTFAKAYVVTVPSKNWSLYYLGEQFSDFLKNTQPDNQSDPDQIAFIALPAQIALFERAYAEVLLAPGLENNAISEIGYNLTFLQSQVILQTPPCLQLLQLDYPILELIDSVKKSKDYTIPQLKKSLLAITRVDYRVTITELDDWQMSFLSACTNPVSAHGAVSKITENSDFEASDLLAKLLIWLPVAEEKGLIVCNR